MFGNAESLVKKRRALDALEAEWLADVAEYDRSGAWQTDGYGSAASALRHVCHVDHGTAHRYVSVARKLTRLEAVSEAYAQGEISLRHVDVLANAYTTTRAAALADVEAQLVDVARQVTPKELGVVVRRYTDQIDGDGGADADATEFDARQLYLAKTLGGRWEVRGSCDHLTGEVIAAAVNAEMVRDLQADDDRPTPMRRMDALTNLCRHALQNGALGEIHGVRPHLSVVIDVDELPQFGAAGPARLRTELRHDGSLSAASIEFLTCDCDITRIMLAGSEVLDLGRSTPVTSPAQWKALVARDRHCQAPGCHRPPAECQSHHREHWTRGGKTDLDNLELLCWYHHRQRHLDDAKTRATADRASTAPATSNVRSRERCDRTPGTG
jgi:hypothetical protein